MMKLIIVQGSTATGKTTLAKHLQQQLGVRACLKDSYKEKRYNKLPSVPSLKQWLIIENASWQHLYDALDDAIAHDQDVIIEGNFMAAQKRQITKRITQKVDVREIYCHSQSKTVVKRFTQRYKSGERHVGHRDNLWVPIVWLDTKTSKIGLGPIHPLRLSGHVLKLNTNDFSAINYQKIFDFIAN